MKTKKKLPLKRLLGYTKSQIPLVIFSLSASAVSVFAGLLVPVIIGKAIDLVVSKGQVDFNGLVPILCALGVAAAINALFQWLSGYLTNKLTQKTIKLMRDDCIRKIQRLPLSAIDRTPHGDYINRIVNDIEMVGESLLQGTNQLSTGLFTIIGTLIFMLLTNGLITLIVVLLTPLSLFVAWFLAKRSYNKFKEQSQLKGQLTALAEERISGLKVVKAFSQEKNSEDAFNEIDGKLNKVGMLAQFYPSLTNPCTRFVNSMVYAAVGVVGAVSIIQFNAITVGQLTCFLNYANQYTKPFNEISGVITELSSAIASAVRVFEMLDKKEDIDEGKNEIPAQDCKGNIEIDHVGFSYTDDKPLIQDFNLNVKSGQKIAIVGHTGCGKTTIINLLMRFYDVKNGEIRIDSVPINNLKKKSLRNLFGMVLQETWLSNTSIKKNIAYGNENATDEEIIAAAKKAHAHSFIKRLPNGYDTVLDEDGQNLSTGQKQLLCIARIMLLSPPILILDEATSNIDTMTEIKIQKAFNAMMKGKTSFIVAHRLSTIKEADCIVVMENGNIAEQGTHKELLKKNGVYKKLYESQFAVY